MSIAYSVQAEVQHGAMDYTTPPCNLDEVRMYRLGRVQQELVERDLAGIILFDQLGIWVSRLPSKPKGIETG